MPPSSIDASTDLPDAAMELTDAAVDAPDAAVDSPDAAVEPDPCDLVTCASTERCVDGVCLPVSCGSRVCGASEACEDGGCVDVSCRGITCAVNEVCTGGTCLPLDCAGVTCSGGTVCLDDVCVEPACAGVSCDAGPCRAGQCPAATCGDAGACNVGFVCADDACVDARCASITCAPGFQCSAGTCVAGCTPSGSTETRCSDGVDDDCDGRADCADSECNQRACADDGRTCSQDVCLDGQCAHPPMDAGVVCRASVGGCDVAERCSGTSTTCPADVFSATCACPEHGPLSGYSEGDGLRTIAASSFVLRDTNTWVSYAALIDGLGLPKVGLDVLPLNRTATPMSSKPWPGFGGGFFWEAGDLSVAYWIPQGLGGGVAGARSMVAVAWHYDETDNASDANPPVDGTDKGVRMTFADVTSLSAGVTYRHVLLVEPDATRGFKPVPIHAGGVAWSGSLLYVADTSRGLRVFDLTRILQVSTAAACSSRAGVANGQACAYGYAYVLPQVGGYYFPSGLSASCRPNFSFVALDRSTTPDSLISGEYDNDPSLGIYSRLFRWPLAAGSSRLATGPTGVVTATGAWYAGNRNLQGGVASNGKFFLNSTRSSGILFTGTVGSASRALYATSNDWGYMPEGMHLSAAGNLWISTEGHSSLARSVYFVRSADVP